MRQNLDNETLKEFKLGKMSREEIVKLVRLYADVNTGGLLDPLCHHYTHPEISGLIGYRLEGKNAVVFGDPVCAKEQKGALALAFQKYCEEKNLGVIYSAVSMDFAHFAAKYLSSVLIEFGETFVLNPLHNPIDNTGHKASLVRKKFKHAIKEGASAEEYIGSDPLLEEQMNQVSVCWLKGRKGFQVHMSHIHLFKDRLGKRWFYAKCGDRVIGLLVIHQIKSFEGWLLNSVMVIPDAPHGVSELLIITALNKLKEEGCPFVLIGPVPAKQLGEIIGLSRFSKLIAHFIYRFAKVLFRLDRHEVFWGKFQPEKQKSYILFCKKNFSCRSVKALFNAFNVGL